MGSMRGLLALACLLQLGLAVHARFVVEQGGVKVKFPASARQKYPKGFDTSLANFGKLFWLCSALPRVINTLFSPQNDGMVSCLPR